MKYSPGPWHTLKWRTCWISGHKHFYISIVNRDTGIAIVILPEEDDTPDCRAERKATAQLASLAPELRDALQGLLDNLKLNSGKGIGLGPITKAKTVLAKVK